MTAHNFKDRRGERHGRLVVQRRATDSSWGHTRWHCLCDCGKRCVVVTCHLQRKSTKSCGCLARELGAQKRTAPVGERHGRLTIKGWAPKNRWGNGMLWVECDCGYLFRTQRRHVMSGRSSSCGCNRGRKNETIGRETATQSRSAA